MRTHIRALSIVGVVAGLLLSAVAAIPANAATTVPPKPSLSQLQEEASHADLSAYAAYTHCNDNYAIRTLGPGYAEVPVDSTASANCILEEGNSSIAVTDLQISLNVCYGKGLAEDGVFGPATYNAVLQVQSQIGVTVDGVYGPGTRHAMVWYDYYTSNSCYHLFNNL